MLRISKRTNKGTPLRFLTTLPANLFITSSCRGTSQEKIANELPFLSPVILSACGECKACKKDGNVYSKKNQILVISSFLAMLDRHSRIRMYNVVQTQRQDVDENNIRLPVGLGGTMSSLGTPEANNRPYKHMN